MLFHGASLRAEGVSDDGLRSQNGLLRELQLAPLEEAILGFALMAKADPTELTDEMVAELRRLGVTDAQLVEAIEVMANANTFNTLAHALGIEPD